MAAEAAKGLGEGLGKVGSGLAKQVILPKHWGRNALIVAGGVVFLPAVAAAGSAAAAGGSASAAFMTQAATTATSSAVTVANSTLPALKAAWMGTTSTFAYVGSLPWNEMYSAAEAAAHAAPTMAIAA